MTSRPDVMQLFIFFSFKERKHTRADQKRREVWGNRGKFCNVVIFTASVFHRRLFKSSHKHTRLVFAENMNYSVRRQTMNQSVLWTLWIIKHQHDHTLTSSTVNAPILNFYLKDEVITSVCKAANLNKTNTSDLLMRKPLVLLKNSQSREKIHKMAIMHPLRGS